eukprot:879175_1
MSSDNESESNKFHIPVMDFQDYQAQQNNIQSSRDDMFLDFEQTKPRRFNQRKRHSIRPASNLRGNRTSTHRSSTIHGDTTPLTPMEQIQIVRNSTRSKSPMSQHSIQFTPSVSGNNNNNSNNTFTDLQNHHINNNNGTPPPLNKPKSITLIYENDNNNNIKLPFHSISQPPSPINDNDNNDNDNNNNNNNNN